MRPFRGSMPNRRGGGKLPFSSSLLPSSKPLNSKRQRPTRRVGGGAAVEEEREGSLSPVRSPSWDPAAKRLRRQARDAGAAGGGMEGNGQLPPDMLVNNGEHQQQPRPVRIRFEPHHDDDG